VPPRALCSKCHASNMEWQQMEGTGKLVAFTCISIGPPEMINQGYNRENPYCTGVIELKEKARVVARIQGVDPKVPNQIPVGMSLQVEFLREENSLQQKIVLAFKPLAKS